MVPSTQLSDSQRVPSHKTSHLPAPPWYPPFEQLEIIPTAGPAADQGLTQMEEHPASQTRIKIYSTSAITSINK